MVRSLRALAVLVLAVISGPTPPPAGAAAAKVVLYPVPPGQPRSEEYRVTVDGKPLDLYIAPTWRPSYGPSFGGPYSFAPFDLEGRAEVRVTAEKPLSRRASTCRRASDVG